MNKRNLCIILFFSFLCNASYALEQLPAGLTSLNSSKGQQQVLKSKNQSKLFILMSHFITQKTQSYCGIASSVMALNALEIKSPLDPIYKPYDYFDQDDFFTPPVSSIISSADVLKKGVTLNQLSNALATFPITVTAVHGADITLKQFRALLFLRLKDPKSMLIVNFARNTLHQVGHGHFSPIAAFNKADDAVLILDVARYKYQPFWVKITDLWSAIRTIDNDSGLTRGLIIIEKK